jgi:uncharacterized membrane protein YfcA
MRAREARASAAAGMAAGAYIGARVQGRFSDEATQKFFAAVFVVIGLVFLVFTLFRGRS